MASRRSVLWRIWIYAAVVATTFVVVAATGSLPSAHEAREFGEGLGGFAAAAYVPLFVIANFLITWPILAGAGGLLFGTAAGAPLALVGVTLAALAQMWVARSLAGAHVGALLPRRTRALEEFLTRHGAVSVMESRIVPALPYGLVNYSAGLTRLRFRDMTLGTLVGAAPKVFAYTALGGSLTNLTSPEAIVAVAVLVVLALVGVLFVRRQIAAERGAASA
jgi:uncharacterized membrane protein YdjX (TVP38/TMEM64 family)